MSNLIVQYDIHTIPLQENQTAIMLTEGKIMSDNVKITFPLISSNNEEIIEVNELPKRDVNVNATYLYQGKKYKGRPRFSDIAVYYKNTDDNLETFMSFTYSSGKSIMDFMSFSEGEMDDFMLSYSNLSSKENDELIKLSKIPEDGDRIIHLYYIENEENEKVWFKTVDGWQPFSSMATTENAEGEQENLIYKGDIYYFSDIETIDPGYYAIFEIEWTPEKIIEVSSLPADLTPYSLYKKDDLYYRMPKKIQQVYHVVDGKIYTMEEMFIEEDNNALEAFSMHYTHYRDTPLFSFQSDVTLMFIFLLANTWFISLHYYPEILPENATEERLYLLGMPYSEFFTSQFNTPISFLGEISNISEITNLETNGYYILTGPEEILAPNETKIIYENGLYDVLNIDTLIVKSGKPVVFGKYNFTYSQLLQFPTEEEKETFTFTCNGEKYYGIIEHWEETVYFIKEDGSKIIAVDLGNWQIPYNEANDSIDIYFDLQTVSANIYEKIQNGINLSQNFSFTDLYYFNISNPNNSEYTRYTYTEELTLWKEWIESESNTDNFFISEEEIHITISDKEYKVKDVKPTTLLTYTKIYYLEEII